MIQRDWKVLVGRTVSFLSTITLLLPLQLQQYRLDSVSDDGETRDGDTESSTAGYIQKGAASPESLSVKSSSI